MKKVYLVDLGTGTPRNLMPLAAGLLVAYAKSLPEIQKQYSFEIRVLDDTIENTVEGLNKPYVVGFSCYSWNVLGTLHAAKLCKEKFPEALVVLGGHNVPSDPRRIGPFFQAHSYVDVLIHGEGELTFSELLLADIERRGFSHVNGLSYRIAQLPGFVKCGPRQRIADFAKIPSPYLTGVYDEVLERYRGNFYGALWESTRGCPFECTYCAWGDPVVKKVSRLTMERLTRELDVISEKKIDFVLNTDANFGMFFDRDMALARHIVGLNRQNGYPSQFATIWTKNSHKNIVDLANVFKNGGMNVDVTLAVQSLNVKTLEAIKRKNIHFDQLAALKRLISKNNIPTYTEFILPLPEETYESFIDGMNRAPSPFLEDRVMVHVCTILENTEMAQPEYIDKYKLETRTCSVGINHRVYRFDRFGEEVIVVGTSTMTNAEWQKAYVLAYAFLALYNLRIAFFVIAYLHEEIDAKYMDVIEFFYQESLAWPGSFPVFTKAFGHLHMVREKILNGISSVSEVEGSEGMCFSPDVGMLFVLANHLDEFFTELTRLCQHFCDKNGLTLDAEKLAEVVLFQKIRVPVNDPPKTIYDFKYNVDSYFQALCRGEKPPPLQSSPNRLVVEIPLSDCCS